VPHDCLALSRVRSQQSIRGAAGGRSSAICRSLGPNIGSPCPQPQAGTSGTPASDFRASIYWRPFRSGLHVRTRSRRYSPLAPSAVSSISLPCSTPQASGLPQETSARRVLLEASRCELIRCHGDSIVDGGVEGEYQRLASRAPVPLQPLRSSWCAVLWWAVEDLNL
jgi:hypothetical protein